MKTQDAINMKKSLPRAVANDVWPNGAVMECKVCGRKQYLTTEECGRALFGGGWPECCGQTMIMLPAGEEGGS